MKLKVKDYVVLALLLLGIVSSFKFIDMPFWSYLIIGVLYFTIRYGVKLD